MVRNAPAALSRGASWGLVTHTGDWSPEPDALFDHLVGEGMPRTVADRHATQTPRLSVRLMASVPMRAF